MPDSPSLFIDNHPGYCHDESCPHQVIELRPGRWYITAGHPGFNSLANNADGYRTRAAAVTTIRRYAKL